MINAQRSPGLQLMYLLGSQMPQSNVLAVLHSRSLVVYSVAVTQNPVAGQPPVMLFFRGSEFIVCLQVEVNRMYDHPQDRPASNFVVGAFGSAYGKDFVCVQSMDGLLSFFEQVPSVVRLPPVPTCTTCCRRREHSQSFALTLCCLAQLFTMPRCLVPEYQMGC